MERYKLYSISIKGSNEILQGILLSEGEEWLLFESIFSDYILDGYSIIRKKYIQEISRDDNDIFTEKVLKASNKWRNTNNNIIIPLETELLLNYIAENKITIQIYLKDPHISYIGKIKKILSKSFYMIPLGTKGQWLKKDYMFRKDYIRVINFETDYINSLLAYNDSLDPLQISETDS